MNFHSVAIVLNLVTRVNIHKRNKKDKVNTGTHIIKTPTQLSRQPHIHTPTHYKTNTYTHPHITEQPQYKIHTKYLSFRVLTSATRSAAQQNVNLYSVSFSKQTAIFFLIKINGVVLVMETYWVYWFFLRCFEDFPASKIRSFQASHVFYHRILFVFWWTLSHCVVTVQSIF